MKTDHVQARHLRAGDRLLDGRLVAEVKLSGSGLTVLVNSGRRRRLKAVEPVEIRQRPEDAARELRTALVLVGLLKATIEEALTILGLKGVTVHRVGLSEQGIVGYELRRRRNPLSDAEHAAVHRSREVYDLARRIHRLTVGLALG